MPNYDFRCKDCRRVFTLSLARIAELDQVKPRCPACGSLDLTRLIRRVNILTGEDTRMERLMDPARLSGLDEEDPRTMGRFMREMAGELGDDAGPETYEMIERLEAGESAADSEQSLIGGSESDVVGGEL